MTENLPARSDEALVTEVSTIDQQLAAYRTEAANIAADLVLLRERIAQHNLRLGDIRTAVRSLEAHKRLRQRFLFDLNRISE